MSEKSSAGVGEIPFNFQETVLCVGFCLGEICVPEGRRIAGKMQRKRRRRPNLPPFIYFLCAKRPKVPVLFHCFLDCISGLRFTLVIDCLRNAI